MGTLKFRAACGPWVILSVWLALTPFWIQRESLWMDEAGSAVKAMAESPGGVWQELIQEKNSNLHLPAYHYYLWAVARILGHGEFALRFANVPWMLLGFVFLILGASLRAENPARPAWLALFLTTSPFLIYYANEVRPYAMQFGLACMSFAGMWGVCQNSRKSGWAWAMAVGTVMLAWTTVYGLAWWLINLWFWFQRADGRESPSRSRLVGAFFLAGGLTAFLYHGWVATTGAAASRLAPTSWGSLGYGVFEWTGAAGFLPGRSALRAGAVPTLREYGWALLTVALAAGLGWAGFRSLGQKPRNLPLPLVWLSPAAGILATGFLRGFRLLGRHFFPLAPAFFWFLSASWDRSNVRPWIRVAGFGLVALWIISNHRLATDPSHRRDDYRGAASFISENAGDGEVIWWAADGAAFRYYGLAGAILMMSPPESALTDSPFPDWVVLSKPDVFDQHEAIRKFILTHGLVRVATLPSFEIYRESSRRSP